MDESLKEQSFYVERLCLKNFKKFKRADIELGKGLNFLIGPNNAGKSTILEALDIVIGGTWLSEEMVDSTFFFEEEKDFAIFAKIEFPKIGGVSNERRINFIRNLKLSKGSGRSVIEGTYTNDSIEEIFEGKKVEGVYNSVSEGKIVSGKKTIDIEAELEGGIKEIYFVSSAETEDDGAYVLENYVWICFENPIKMYDDSRKVENGFSAVKVLLGRQMRSNLISFLFVPAARSENRQLFQVAPYTWLGKYLKSLQRDQKDSVRSFFERNRDNDFPIQPDEIANSVLRDILNGEEKISFHAFDNQHEDTLFKYAHVFLEDPFFAEIEQKGHGVQSATAIALFASLLEREAKNRPEYSARTSGSTQKHWATILEIEEPESHFHPPARARLIALLKEKFVDFGAQVILSTHDAGFVKWPYANGSNFIFPSAINSDSGEIKSFIFSETGNYESEGDSPNARLLRFQSQTVFSEKVLIVEGCESVCMDAMFMRLFGENFSSNSIVIAQSVSPKTRVSHGDSANVQAGGGASQISDTVDLYRHLNIKCACLIDIDCLFNGSINRIIEAFGGKVLEFDFTELLSDSECRTAAGGMILAKKMREKIRSQKEKEEQLEVLLLKLATLGIFIFNGGDFEANFREEFVSGFIHKDGVIIKEALAYATKSRAEIDDNFESDCLSSDAKVSLKKFFDELKKYLNKVEL